ncbi:MAG TPA: pyrophosphate--fructose-6-phosphate 1-phosphotransferase [Gemmatimonadales bacterium]|jgi:pyrophosphate--fructose-6-phosphate 1-phosphotransferase
MTAPRTVALLTAGGLAPCLSSAIAALVEEYAHRAPDVRIIGYRNGYQGLLTGDSVSFTAGARAEIARLHEFGGSPLGNSRVKLSNRADNVRHGFIKEGEDARQVAADRLRADSVDILHTIGGDDTNLAAADLAAFLAANNHPLTVVGLPKTVDNDVTPIRQSLGAVTAAEQGARFFANVVAEQSANPRMLLVHEVMGRNCGWLTAATAQAYREQLNERHFLPAIGFARQRYEIHGIFLPELPLDIAGEAARLRGVMDAVGSVNIFVSEGAGVSSIVAEMTARGESIQVDAFGHVRLDTINPGAWFGRQFAAMIGAEKTLVQKSGYFARSAPANAADRELIRRSAAVAVDAALRGISGVVGEDEEHDNTMGVIEFGRIRGGKPFDASTLWFMAMLKEIGQR